MHKGRTSWGNEYSPHEFVKILTKLKVQVFAAQEFHFSEAWLSAFQEEARLPFVQKGLTRKSGLKEYGNAIFSTHPLHQVSTRSLSLHRFEQRNFLAASVQFSKNSFVVLNTHLNLLKRHQKLQIKTIQQHLVECFSHHEPLVLCGDFNDWSEQHISSLTSSGLHEVFFKVHGRVQPTFPSIFPVLSLDRLYVRNIEVLQAQVLKNRQWQMMSDHLPLLVDIAF